MFKQSRLRRIMPYIRASVLSAALFLLDAAGANCQQNPAEPKRGFIETADSAFFASESPEQFLDFLNRNQTAVDIDMVNILLSESAARRDEFRLLMTAMMASVKGYKREQASAMKALGGLCSSLYRYNEAAAYLMAALSLLDVTTETAEQAEIFENLGWIAFRTGRDILDKNAEILFLNAGALYTRSGDIAKRARVMQALGDIARARESFAGSIVFDAPELNLKYPKAWYLLSGEDCENEDDRNCGAGAKRRLASYCSERDIMPLKEIFDLYKSAYAVYYDEYDIKGEADLLTDLAYTLINVEQNPSLREEARPALAELEGSQLYGYLLVNPDDDKEFDLGATIRNLFAEALTVYTGETDLIGMGRAYAGMAAVENGGGRLVYLLKSLEAYERAGCSSGSADAALRLAVLGYEEGDCAAALERIRLAHSLVPHVAAPRLRIEILTMKAKIARACGMMDTALALCLAADSEIERFRRPLLPEEELHILDWLKERKESIIGMLISMRRWDEACGMACNEIAGAFRKEMFLDSAPDDSGSHSSHRREYWRNEIGRVKFLMETGNTAGIRDSLGRVARDYERRARGAVEFITKGGFEKDATKMILEYDGAAVLDAVKKEAAGRGRSVIQYYFLGDRPYVFMIDRHGCRAAPLDCSTEALRKLVGALAEGYRRPPGSGYGVDASVLNDLYGLLFSPVEAFLNPEDTIVIIPDDCLSKLPFEMLIVDEEKSVGNGRYLFERFSISYSPSTAQFLESINRTAARRAPRLLAVGDAVYASGGCVNPAGLKLPEGKSAGAADGEIFSYVPWRVRSLDSERGRLEDLPFSRREIDSIAGIFGGKTLITRCAATGDTIRNGDWTGYSHVLFSCHGYSGRHFNGLILSSDRDGKPESKLLLWQHMAACKFDADLMVLSACETGLGEFIRGEGITGLVRAAMLAGSRAVAASLWNVHDEGASILTVSFFRFLIGKKMNAREALRAAKLEMAAGVHGKRFTSPYYWAGFVLYGE